MPFWLPQKNQIIKLKSMIINKIIVQHVGLQDFKTERAKCSSSIKIYNLNSRKWFFFFKKKILK